MKRLKVLSTSAFLIASILHFGPEELFTAEEYKKQNIKVEI